MPQRDTKGLVGSPQDRERLLSIPTGKDTVSSRALAITRFSIICRCRDSVCGAGGELGTSTTPHGHQWGAGVPRDQLSAPSQLPTCQGCLLHSLAWVQPCHPRLVRCLQLLVLQGGLLQRGQLPVGTASALATGHRTRARTTSCSLPAPGRHGAIASPCVAVLATPHVPNPSCLNPPCLTRCV